MKTSEDPREISDQIPFNERIEVKNDFLNIYYNEYKLTTAFVT